MDNYIYAILILAGLFFSSCDTKKQAGHAPHIDGTAITIWTERTELFAEFPSLLAGQSADVAFHLTNLESFTPVTSGQVVILASSEDGPGFEVTIDSASSPGIYRSSIVFKSAGRYTLNIVVGATGNDTLMINKLFVGSPGHLDHVHGEATSVQEISFLKEQQWNTEFRCEPVGDEKIAASLQVTGEVIPRVGGEAVVTAPFSGYCPVSASGMLKTPGARITKGAALMTFIPSVETQGGSDDFASRLANARADRDVATAEVERSRLLYNKGMIAKKKLLEAEAEWKRSESSYNSLRSAVHSAGEPDDRSGSAGYLVKAPMSGTLARIFFSPGQQVEAGDPLFQIVNSSSLWLRTYIPMIDAGRFRDPVLLAMQMPGARKPFVFDSLTTHRVSMGAVIDEHTRSIPVIFEFQNPKGLFKIGMNGQVHLTTGKYWSGLAVPEQALLEDQGQYFVFVQTGGESFIRKEITLGSQMGNKVEILSGLKRGDRVVTVGAPQLRLASSSSSVPTHGHTH